MESYSMRGKPRAADLPAKPHCALSQNLLLFSFPWRLCYILYYSYSFLLMSCGFLLDKVFVIYSLVSNPTFLLSIFVLLHLNSGVFLLAFQHPPAPHIKQSQAGLSNDTSLLSYCSELSAVHSIIVGLWMLASQLCGIYPNSINQTYFSHVAKFMFLEHARYVILIPCLPLYTLQKGPPHLPILSKRSKSISPSSMKFILTSPGILIFLLKHFL
jgi:hypothetical protein